jgi:hypothetical protein
VFVLTFKPQNDLAAFGTDEFSFHEKFLKLKKGENKIFLTIDTSQSSHYNIVKQ